MTPLKAGILNDSEFYRQRRENIKGKYSKRGRPATEIWLTEEQALLLEVAASVEEAAEDWERDVNLISRVANALRAEAAALAFPLLVLVL